jgi:hypothetical protein
MISMLSPAKDIQQQIVGRRRCFKSSFYLLIHTWLQPGDVESVFGLASFRLIFRLRHTWVKPGVNETKSRAVDFCSPST